MTKLDFCLYVQTENGSRLPIMIGMGQECIEAGKTLLGKYVFVSGGDAQVDKVIAVAVEPMMRR